MEAELERLHEAATRAYAAIGRRAWHFARGKLRHDPVYFSLLRSGTLPGSGRLLDAGCGTGILLSLLVTAAKQYRRGMWPQGWPAPPLSLDLYGIDLRPDRVKAARAALRDEAQVEARDLRDFTFPRCSAVAMLDVLMYLDRPEQGRALEKASAALEPGGVLLLREADAGAGLAFEITRAAERLAGAPRGEFLRRLTYRSALEWRSALSELGLAVRVESMSQGTPFANVLFIASKASVVKSDF